METEIELKFFVSPEFSHQIRDKLTGLKVLQQSRRDLGNIYYDTPDLLLRQHDTGLRVRRYDDVYVQTLKTAGRVVAGLHQRPEYNAELDGPGPVLSLLPADVWPDGIDAATLQQQITPLFSTDFERQQWLVAMPDGSQIELAHDNGTVTTSEGGLDPISEVELELISGQTDALFTLARELADKGGLRLGNLSKAARGYRLACGYEGSQCQTLQVLELDEHASTEQAFVQSVEHALAHWHYHEQIYIERPDPQALREMSLAIGLVRQALALFGGLIPRRASALLRQELQWLEGELDWLEEANAISRLLDDKGHFLRKLSTSKPLKKQLAQRYRDLPERSEMLELLHSSRYCNLLLDLSRWLLTKGWQPFLDDKASTKLAEPAKGFADKMLAISWDELLNVFDEGNELDRFGYMDQRGRLVRNLLTGTCLASLYDYDARKSFRMPWHDLLQGVEDLQLLEPVRSLLEEFDGEDRTQLEKWLKRKEDSLLHAMLQSRHMGVGLVPYWED